MASRTSPTADPPLTARTTAVAVRPEPRWQAILAVFAVGGLQLALPRSMTMGPQWLLLAIVATLSIPTILARRRGRYRVNQVLGYVISTVITVALVMALIDLVAALPKHTESPSALLRSGAILWVTNVLVFASWYWRLDAGGPNLRDQRKAHVDGAFMFPQMIPGAANTGWRPGFIDYLFLAFNTSTAFSPTDSPVLSRWAKLLSMVQATISFTTVALLVARAVNIL